MISIYAPEVIENLVVAMAYDPWYLELEEFGEHPDFDYQSWLDSEPPGWLFDAYAQDLLEDPSWITPDFLL